MRRGGASDTTGDAGAKPVIVCGMVITSKGAVSAAVNAGTAVARSTRPVCTALLAMPVIVQLLAPTAMLQDVVPVRAPVPVWIARLTVVAAVTLVGASAAFCVCTLTLNGASTCTEGVGCAVMASLVGPTTTRVQVMLSTPTQSLKSPGRMATEVMTLPTPETVSVCRPAPRSRHG